MPAPCWSSTKSVRHPGPEARGYERHQEAETRASLQERGTPVLAAFPWSQSPDHWLLTAVQRADRMRKGNLKLLLNIGFKLGEDWVQDNGQQHLTRLRLLPILPNPETHHLPSHPDAFPPHPVLLVSLPPSPKLVFVQLLFILHSFKANVTSSGKPSMITFSKMHAHGSTSL